MQALQRGSGRQRSGQRAGFVPGKPARPLCSEDAPQQPAARPAAAPGQQCPNNAWRGWAGAGGGLGGRGRGLRRGGEGAGSAGSAVLEAAQRRRLHHPGLRAGQRRAGGTRVCAEGLLAQAAPSRALWTGPGGRGRCAEMGGRRRVETSPGPGDPGGSEGDWPVRPRGLLCLPTSLSNHLPWRPRPNAAFP